MLPKITIKKDYILVEPSKGVNYWEIYEGVGELLTMKEFPRKNDVWVFRNGPVRLSYEDLYKLKDFVTVHYPKNFKGHKTAIVVETGFQSALSKIYAIITDVLPFEIKVFSDIQSAENWIIK